MNRPRERIPVAEEYLKALGRATYNFAYLEWGMVWLAETTDRGFLEKARKLTAGQIAEGYLQAVRRMEQNSAEKSALEAVGGGFKALVEDRNRLVHGNPFNANGGEQRLLYDGKHGRKDWTVRQIEEFSDRFAISSIEAGRLLHDGRYEAWKQTTDG